MGGGNVLSSNDCLFTVSVSQPDILFGFPIAFTIVVPFMRKVKVFTHISHSGLTVLRRIQINMFCRFPDYRPNGALYFYLPDALEIESFTPAVLKSTRHLTIAHIVCIKVS